ncbi:MAG: Rrf2 family transcriptional regulator [Candidatus Omnitrophica bacterium]|nr:Rrf2 family transcriptional regulator [Candidatus Omnitrophota bacterium]
MKLITRDTDYAMRALCFIAQSKARVVPVSTLVDKLRIPRPFLRQILQVLNKNGVLKSLKGSGGGFQLAILPQQILLADLIKIFQGPLKINECIFKKKLCPNRSTCTLRDKISSIEKDVILELGKITVSSLLKKQNQALTCGVRGMRE